MFFLHGSRGDPGRLAAVLARAPTRTLCVLALCVGPLACQTTRFTGHSIVKPDVTYEVGQIASGWRRVKLADNDLAFVSETSGHSMGINALCEGHDDPPLPVLIQHLLIGFTERRQLEEKAVWLDNREGLRARYEARLDGVPIEMLFTVLKKDGCVYDFTYLSPEGRFEERLADYEALVLGFHAKERGG